MTNHPITPPPELVQQWVNQFIGNQECMPEQVYIARAAAQWGADQELEACCEWPRCDGKALRLFRRPKPPSLAEEALQALDEADAGLTEMEWPQRSDQIRRALERLQELEGGND